MDGNSDKKTVPAVGLKPNRKDRRAAKQKLRGQRRRARKLEMPTELDIKIAASPKDNKIVINFGTPVMLLTMPKKNAIEIANGILEKANELRDEEREAAT